MLKISILIINSLLFLSALTAQNYRYTIYNTETSNLQQNQIISLFQDSKNNIWIGTKFGAAKYDGESFKIYSPHTGTASGDVQYIFETSKGEILLCTVSGSITKINGDRITVYKSFKEYRGYNYKQVHDSLIIIARYKDNLKKSILLSFNKGKYKRLENFKGEFYNLIYANDTLWILKRDCIRQYKFGYLDKNYKFTNLNINIPIIYFQNRVDTLYLSNNKAIYKYFKGKLTKIIKVDSLLSVIATNNSFFTRSRIKPNNIFEYDYAGKQIATFNIPDFRNVITDKERNTWFATESGLYKLAERAFKHYVYKDYSINISNSGVIVDKNNDIWLSSFNGKLYKYTDNKFIDYSEKLQKKDFRFLISRLVKPDGTIIWGCSGRGIIKKKGNKFAYTYENITNVFEIYYDTLTQNTLYGHGEGVLIENNNNDVIFNTALIKKSMVLAIEKDTAGWYWFANRGRIHKFKDNTLIQIYDSVFTNGALDIVHDTHHNLWFGGEGGLVFYDNKKFKKIEHPKLLNKAITTLHVVGDSVLFIGTTSGMAVMDLKTFYKSNCKKEIIKYYNSRNGFSSNECAQNGFSEDKNGFIWIPVNDRLIQIDPRQLSFDNVQLEPYISSISIIKNDIWEKHDTTRHILYYDEDRIKFQFSGAYFSNPVVYSYYLEGEEKNWREYSNSKEAIYTNLAAGKYTFHVKALNGQEPENPLQATYSFKIKRAIWETFWFYFIVFLLISISIYFIIRQRFRIKAEKQQKHFEQSKLMMQVQLSQLDPHFIFNTLTTTGTFALRLKQVGIYDIIVRFSQLLRIHWSNDELIRPLEEELLFIKEYCELNRMNHGERFDYTIDIDQNVDTSIKVLKLSIQNFVENAIKHGIENITEHGEIKISVKQDDIYTRIIIDDNGIGYNKTVNKKKDQKPSGIKRLNETFDLYNSWNKYKLDFEIKDKSEIDANLKGTLVKINIPNKYIYEYGN